MVFILILFYMNYITLSFEYLIMYEQDSILLRSSLALALEMAATTEALPYSCGYVKLLLPTLPVTYQ